MRRHGGLTPNRSPFQDQNNTLFHKQALSYPETSTAFPPAVIPRQKSQSHRITNRNESWRGHRPQPNQPIKSRSRRPVAKVLLNRAEQRCCVSAQRASSSDSLAQRAREIATKPSSRPNGSAVHLQCPPNGRPVGPKNIFFARGPGPPGQAIGTGGPLGRKRR